MVPSVSITTAHPPRPLPSADDPAACAAEVNRLLVGHSSSAQERRALDVLEQCSGPVLDEVLKQVDLERLVHGLDEHGGHENHRSELFDLVTRRQGQVLSPEVKAGLVDGLQRDRTTLLEETAIRDLLLCTHGEALTEMKNRIDAGGDYHDLAEAVFHDVDHVSLQEDIVAHIAREAVPRGGVKVCSDIDDTFYCNLNDRRYPEKTVYPGVRQLYRELDLADGRAGDLTFITARPDEPTGIGENMTHRMLRRNGVPEAVVLTGTLGSVWTNAEIAEEKHENLQMYRRLYPEYDTVLLGDSGQGDIMFEEMALRSQGAAVRGAFIHDVVGLPAAERERLRGRGVVLFDTYVDAAVEAFHKGLLTREAVQRVADASVTEMAAVVFDSAAQRNARMAELAAALARVQALS